MPTKHYGYTGKVPDSAPDDNMELFLQNLMLTAELELEHKLTEPKEESWAENADTPAGHQQTIDEIAAPPIDPRLILANIAAEEVPVVRPRQHRKPPDILASEPSLDAKPHIDKKA